jgi:hypothetical protein
MKQADDAVGDIVSALRIAANVTEHPCEFALLGLIRSLYEISASCSFKLGEAVSKIRLFTIGMIGLRIELGALAKRSVQMG